MTASADKLDVDQTYITQQQVRLLYLQAPVSNVTVFAIALLFYVFLSARVESHLTGIWIVALYLAAGFRLFLWYWRKIKPEQAPERLWLRRYLIGCGLVGVSWSLIIPVIYLSSDPIVSIGLYMLVFGVASSAVVVLAVYLPAFVVYVYPQILTLSATLLYFQDSGYTLLAVSVLAYLLMTTLFTRNINRNRLRSIALEAHNARLIDELNQEVSERENLIRHRTSELRESEQRLSAFFEASPAGMALLDTQFRYQRINDTLANMHGMTAQENIGKSVAETMPKDGAVVERLFTQILQTNTPITDMDLSGEVPSRPGESSHFTVAYFPIPNDDKAIGGIGAVVIDITEKKRAEEALRESQERFELAMRGANDGVYDWNLIDNSIYYSPRWKRMLGYENDELPNDFSVWEELVDATDRKRSLEMLDDYINGLRDNFSVEFKMRHKEGHWVDILSRAFLLRDDDGQAIRVVGTHVDISEKKRQEQQILHQAHYDDLTQLPNRLLALDRLQQVIKEAARTEERLAVLFLDLDGFKRINDTLGHETGDQLLVQAAQRLEDTVRREDSVCRLGGDEFIVLLGGLKRASDARQVASNVVTRFRAPFTLGERELLVTASIGIALYPDDGSNAAELLRKADTAMYHSKEQGRNTYHYFTDAMNNEVARRLEVEEQLHGALNRDEFKVVYQPIVGLPDAAIVGAEALLRWRNASLGQVSPDEFIPIAEQTGSILELGQYVLTQALSCVQQWNKDNEDRFRVAVNLSPRQFRDPELTAMISRSLSHYETPPQALELEITEGVLLGGHAHIQQALQALTELGVGISMDDFGTGYSSLNYLRSYPFHVLKIDRSFVQDITIDPADRELVNAAILMAHGLGLKVIAEGVETAEQYEDLNKMGCDYAQGYYFSMPMDAEALTRRLANSSTSRPKSELSRSAP